ncbi:uncharacterized protein LOC118765009 [Octopus sinensis]|uniref:Uncharacterized protein LOC118765009 n=1 Tax=Octopus sinensis TaxID=2607531 RepID=A0A7E6F5B5_9MOLL|nr:uncharacterized protein LOC118765009 [Octopus sinensis]
MAKDKQRKPQVIKIINLSNKELTPNELSILSKGLKFTPTPQRSNYYEMKDDILEFCRKLRLTEEFHGKQIDDESIARNNSNYTPTKGKNKVLDRYCDYITNFPFQFTKKQKHSQNFNKREWNDLIKLREDKTITIKEADKGNAVVLMNTNDYKNLVLSLLRDETDYERVQQYNQPKIMYNLRTLINTYREGLMDKEYEYITNFKCKSSLFYDIPKVHKSQIISETCKTSTDILIKIPSPNDLKLRPIIAGPACETHCLSNFLDTLLKPFLKHIKNYVRDDIDMLNHLPKTVNEKTLLVSFDVINLYSNIPHTLGIEAITFWLNNYSFELPTRIKKELIIEGLRFIFENNYFIFDNNFYRQRSGTAMGTRTAPSFANLFGFDWFGIM